MGGVVSRKKSVMPVEIPISEDVNRKGDEDISKPQDELETNELRFLFLKTNAK
jgi:hypothetical protein